MINNAPDIKETATSNVANLTLRHDGIITHELKNGPFKTNLETLPQKIRYFFRLVKR